MNTALSKAIQQSIILWGVVLSILFPLHADASGLVVELLDEADQLGNPVLVPASRIDIDATLAEQDVLLVESRAYAPDSNSFIPARGTATLYRSMTQASDAQVVQALVGGEPVTGTLLLPEEADQVRYQLVAQLGESGPLRDLGTALYVSDPIEFAMTYPGEVLEFTLHVEQSPEPWDTMFGVEVPLDWHSGAVGTMSVDVMTETEGQVRALYAPFHQLQMGAREGNSLSGSFEGYSVCSTIDLVLLFSVGDEPIRVDILPFRYSDNEGGYFLALITPDHDVSELAVVPRDLILVLDISGSMRGEKLEQAQEALNSVLAGLRPEDAFNIVAFNGNVEKYLETAELATAGQVESAQAFVSGLVADGGTNIHDALQTGFSSMPVSWDHPRYLVLLTDGLATAGETDTDAILDMARLYNEIGARVYTFGIGDEVNTVLLDSLASDWSGDAFYIRPGESIEIAVGEFFEQLTDPVLSDPTFEATGFGVSDAYPAVLSDLFAGQTVALLGRYTEPGVAEIQLSGMRSGAIEANIYEAELPAYSVRNAFSPRIWATRHVGTLFQQVKLGDDDPEIVDEAVYYAERYGVITEFTYFAIDENGDTHMVYSEVPVDVSGAVAVDTSAELDAASESGSYGAADGGDSALRWWSDRTLARVEGWHTDTLLQAETLEDASWVDLHFASDAYLSLAADESDIGIGGFLSLGQELRFEHHGRNFRITDADNLDREVIPEETDFVPEVGEAPVGTDARVELLEVIVEPEMLDPDDVDGPDDGNQSVLTDLSAAQPSSGCGDCSVTSPGGASGTLPFLLMSGMAWVAFRRIRRS